MEGAESNHQLYPLELDQNTREPFLRLERHANIIVTPPRWSDAPFLPALMNSVGITVNGEKVPFTFDSAIALVGRIKPQIDAIFERLQGARDMPPIQVPRCPVNFIREIQADGSDVLIGDINIRRCIDPLIMAPSEITDWTLKELQSWVDINEQRPAGDPGIVWTLAVLLSPDRQTKDLYADVINTILEKWAIPRIGVRQIIVEIIGLDSVAGLALQELGFRLIQYSENVRRHIRDSRLVLLQWKWSRD